MFEFGMKIKEVFVLRCVVMLVASGFVSNAYATEIRTYKFVKGEGFTYSADCGLCILVQGTRARVEGRIQVSLDIESGIGSLLSQNIKLVDLEELTPSFSGPSEWLPQPDRAFFGASSLWDSFSLPLTGQLETIGDELILSSLGVNAAVGNVVFPPALFRLTMRNNEAELNFRAPIIDLLPRIAGAKARLVEVIPEPSGLGLAIGITLFFPRRRFL